MQEIGLQSGLQATEIGDRQLNRQRGQPALNQTTRQRITGSLVLAVTALILLPVIFDGEGSYQPSVQPDIPTRPVQPRAALQDPERPVITADTDAIRIRPETPVTVTEIPETETQSSPQTSDSSQASGSQSSPVPSSAAQASAAQSSSSQASAAAQPAPARPAQAAATPPAAQTSQPAALDVQGLPEGWSVRLGSFSSADNASNLVNRLQTAGHRAYTRRVDSSQGVLTAVFVGPLVDRAAAQTLMERLRQDFQLNGMIVRYEIDQL